MIRFSDFDTRDYPTVDVATGYGRWADTYEQTVEDIMDLGLLDRLPRPDWPAVRRAADLGCGTGRTGAWLRSRGVGSVDGVDLTPEMLALAEEKGAHDRLLRADATDTGLKSGAYDLAIASLIDEHLPALGPLYAEASRLVRPGGSFVIAAFHPQFIISSGMPTHFTEATGESVAITTNVHLVSDHIKAGLGNGWSLTHMDEGVIDDAWIATKPKWERFRSVPISAVYVWENREGQEG
ncbi:class I SAM-dependent DNA methyltransferase [Nocardiopsis composta]|uniref:SAM-dependent methyltransferase n=1 Tax=Nocardiopsis composta TaxID=157465 RepID=A0A7W8VFM5_9ACTN|nr:class I SAM-dependent methyltransferase [Nocardiopsis composta]MBB5434562.1 SAM-dependent methyltransferase [Nocardiopsis composta]